MDIQELRRENLARWLEGRNAPAKEKSLFSQLKNGGSFGERVARRLERDYGMEVGYLDRKGEGPALSPEAARFISCIERIDGNGHLSQQIFAHMRAILELTEKSSEERPAHPTQSLIKEEGFLENLASGNPGQSENATRKRAAKPSR